MTDILSPERVVQAFVGARVSQLQQGNRANRSAAVAALARLRRAAGKEPGDALDIFEYTLGDELIYKRADDKASWAEIAAHHAITLYAVHQQSQPRGMHQRGRSLGEAVRRLIPDSEYKPTHAVARRFAMLSTAEDLAELVYHLRGIVQLLRAAGVPLDYGLLAEHLVTWQRPGGRARVGLRWGRDFHVPPKTDKSENTEQKDVP
ncbi:type I-E CRISPR-associated protein Cse2/CasB [Amycolatopsis sp. NPDC059657]|uniref:type I-E CRISPR-associated protein Cse2/CasB n=1 Tax=Amycolatopsis sp. NPDC059657 TaxID=3346899 RepID=UPI003672D95E